MTTGKSEHAYSARIRGFWEPEHQKLCRGSVQLSADELDEFEADAQRELRAELETCKRERDEARAEVERLSKVVVAVS